MKALVYHSSKETILNPKGIRLSAALFGFSRSYWGVPGGQAELVRVPKANVDPIKIPHS
ncbi:hypothetical protein QTI33_08780 [Variovorax sp. J22P271]|uniref:hypothetical protein n=1 Tax=Variovorax davisae TaxID=3053515 RepID=UPI0025774447|nr:hypothetical protein [Variovorax sp. J22P271]MDM0032224.1 hypothetical protein [Variovorax sp. J22P271]